MIVYTHCRPVAIVDIVDTQSRECTHVCGHAAAKSCERLCGCERTNDWVRPHGNEGNEEIGEDFTDMRLHGNEGGELTLWPRGNERTWERTHQEGYIKIIRDILHRVLCQSMLCRLCH